MKRLLGLWGVVLVIVEALAFGYLIDPLAGFLWVGIVVYALLVLEAIEQ